MAEEKKDMPANGGGTSRTMPDDNGELASRRDGDMAGGERNPGESGGGPYPNPHSDQDGERNQGYYGKGQLGEKDIGKSENAPSKRD